MDNLWGGININAVRTPVHVLREQGVFLESRTSGMVKVRVVLHSCGSRELDGDDGKFEYRFELVAPMLDGYSYALFTISFGSDIYPVSILLPYDLRQELGKNRTAANESDFLEILRLVFAATKTKQVIDALISQSIY